LGAFAASFSIAFAYFAPVYSYDDLLQYAFIFMALAAAFEQYWLRAALWLCVAVIARETTLLLLPGMAILALHSGRHPAPGVDPSHGLRRALVVVVVPALFWVAMSLALPFPDMPVRLRHWVFNFADARTGTESVLSAVEALGLLALLEWHNHRRQPSAADGRLPRRQSPEARQALLAACLVTLIINTPIVWVAGMAREARLFALPLVFLWPMAGPWLADAAQDVRETWRTSAHPLRTLVAAPLSAAAVVGILTAVFYKQTIGHSFYDGYRVYLALLAGAAMALYATNISRPPATAGARRPSRR
jgi:hypothetical protein